jgi:outer membrane protein OmpA-like peptidoglycan-associated protein
MRMKLLLAAGVLSFVPAFARAQGVPAAAPAAAHRGGSFEFSLSGGFSLLDKVFYDHFSTDTARIVNGSSGREMIGGQLRATYNFSSHLGLGVGVGIANGLKFASDNGALALAPFGALTYTFNLNRGFSPFIEVGGGFTQVHAYTGSLFPSVDDSATSALSAFGGLGVRAMLGQRLALRVEGRMAYEDFSGPSRPALNGTTTLGFSFFLGGRPPRDTDGDGVPDKRDACADTPAGATVDTLGCALDSDTDGVYDGLDRCADTPAGATVDTLGCALDSDTDGVFDGLDRCPDTPAGVTVNTNGCPVDTDGDGIADYLDRCANTPADVRPVGANGCPLDADDDGVTDNLDRCPNTLATMRPLDASGCPLDSDGDAVPDYLDRCANTAAGTQVDANGCPVRRDIDGDGVNDASDRCPNTPAGSRVDSTGCPLAEPAEPPAPGALPEVGRSLVLSAVQFMAAGSRLTAASQRALDGIAASIRAIPDSRWEVGGYTSSTGTRAGNRRLSLARAQAVAQYLINSGVASRALTAIGYGPANPLAPNNTAANRARNRRVEIRRIQ